MLSFSAWGGGQPEPLGVSWIHGSESAMHNTDPDIQVHWHGEHTVILRQDKAVNYEAPFMFLLFGGSRALLVDTGATASPELFPLRGTVDDLVAQWLGRHPRDDYELVVLHSHSHHDHVAGDGQFADRPRTTVVDAGVEGVYSFLGLSTDDLDRPAALDLGGRVVDCIASPGHDAAAVTFYDAHTGFLLTGDTVYPGRLYVEDWPAFRATIDRLVAFAEAHPVSHVLGCHIEMTTTPGVDYPIRTTFQPDEPPLEMSVEQLRDVQRAVAEIGDHPGRYVYPDFVIHHDGI
ncbi:MBL fold metallo-hydrolase [Phycicoccus sp. Soil748]|uniref:MBL fold metallo-hydrolase n=1 Tax=Phycicoccus sp. Soil748 TaxID=1736397 RepID=UPI000702FDA6|nr:MBL fold metallo-hydrolase [Phycicoccus sp. Soil748]KRE56159.1 MBL fold metallo-hydrolase [Phycicoccus sp. Soil748]